MRGLTSCLILLTLSGCADLVAQKRAALSPTRELSAKGEFVTLPVELRTVTMKNSASSFVSCSEPAPDVAMSNTLRLVTELSRERSNSNQASDQSSSSSTSKTGLKNDLATSTVALELAGRTQTVLLARELLYRNCESAANGWLTGPEVNHFHTEVLKTIVQLVTNDGKKAEAAVANATAALVTAEKLDAAAIGAASAISAAVERKFCVAQFEQCAGKATDDPSRAVCRATFIGCLK